MAVTISTPVKGAFNAITEFAFTTATTAADGIEFTIPKASDEYVSILVTNTDATTAYDITLKKPTTGSYAAAGADLVHELAAGDFAVIRIESARFANTNGKVKLVPENAAVKAAILY